MGTVIPFRSRAQLQQNKNKKTIFRILRSRTEEDIKTAIYYAKMGYNYSLLDQVGQVEYFQVNRDNIFIVEEYLQQLKSTPQTIRREFNVIRNKIYLTDKDPS